MYDSLVVIVKRLSYRQTVAARLTHRHAGSVRRFTGRNSAAGELELAGG